MPAHSKLCGGLAALLFTADAFRIAVEDTDHVYNHDLAAGSAGHHERLAVQHKAGGEADLPEPLTAGEALLIEEQLSFFLSELKHVERDAAGGRGGALTKGGAKTLVEQASAFKKEVKKVVMKDKAAGGVIPQAEASQMMNELDYFVKEVKSILEKAGTQSSARRADATDSDDDEDVQLPDGLELLKHIEDEVNDFKGQLEKVGQDLKITGSKTGPAHAALSMVDDADDDKPKALTAGEGVMMDEQLSFFQNELKNLENAANTGKNSLTKGGAKVLLEQVEAFREEIKKVVEDDAAAGGLIPKSKARGMLKELGSFLKEVKGILQTAGIQSSARPADAVDADDDEEVQVNGGLEILKHLEKECAMFRGQLEELGEELKITGSKTGPAKAALWKIDKLANTGGEAVGKSAPMEDDPDDTDMPGGGTSALVDEDETDEPKPLSSGKGILIDEEVSFFLSELKNLEQAAQAGQNALTKGGAKMLVEQAEAFKKEVKKFVDDDAAAGGVIPQAEASQLLEELNSFLEELKGILASVGTESSARPADATDSDDEELLEPENGLELLKHLEEECAVFRGQVEKMGEQLKITGSKTAPAQAALDTVDSLQRDDGQEDKPEPLTAGEGILIAEQVALFVSELKHTEKNVENGKNTLTRGGATMLFEQVRAFKKEVRHRVEEDAAAGGIIPPAEASQILGDLDTFLKELKGIMETAGMQSSARRADATASHDDEVLELDGGLEILKRLIDESTTFQEQLEQLGESLKISGSKIGLAQAAMSMLDADAASASGANKPGAASASGANKPGALTAGKDVLLVERLSFIESELRMKRLEQAASSRPDKMPQKGMKILMEQLQALHDELQKAVEDDAAAAGVIPPVQGSGIEKGLKSLQEELRGFLGSAGASSSAEGDGEVNVSVKLLQQLEDECAKFRAQLEALDKEAKVE
eukprot:TRINITY_DN10462_c0_g1_i1.p1 TRINITY_DN10462_c0_g1~~TRINITY_DN10462_c0_g1_i1.p1  ORF type:complete len:938 (-),score=301.07 TRINITY_DN10462_c0_g1_i1:88-2901(-)